MVNIVYESKNYQCLGHSLEKYIFIDDSMIFTGRIIENGVNLYEYSSISQKSVEDSIKAYETSIITPTDEYRSKEADREHKRMMDKRNQSNRQRRVNGLRV